MKKQPVYKQPLFKAFEDFFEGADSGTLYDLLDCLADFIESRPGWYYTPRVRQAQSDAIRHFEETILQTTLDAFKQDENQSSNPKG